MCSDFNLLTASPYSRSLPKELLLKAKQDGFSDRQIGQLVGSSEREVRELRLGHGIKPWVKQVRAVVAADKRGRRPQNDSSVPS